MTTTIIRSLSPEEWMSYKALRLEALKNDPDSFGSLYEENIDKTEERWRTELTSSQGWKVFAEIDSEIVGMAAAYCVPTDVGSIAAHLVGVYTKPAFRGRGIAGLLILSLIKVIKADGKINILALEVNKEAASAVRLYEKMGFVYGVPVPDYVRNDGAAFPQYAMSMKLF